jgi:hypothetical protein
MTMALEHREVAAIFPVMRPCGEKRTKFGVVFGAISTATPECATAMSQSAELVLKSRQQMLGAQRPRSGKRVREIRSHSASRFINRSR